MAAGRNLVRRIGIGSPGAGEAQTWTVELKEHTKKISNDAAFNIPEKSWEELLSGTHELRN